MFKHNISVRGRCIEGPVFFEIIYIIFYWGLISNIVRHIEKIGQIHGGITENDDQPADVGGGEEPVHVGDGEAEHLGTALLLLTNLWRGETKNAMCMCDFLGS